MVVIGTSEGEYLPGGMRAVPVPPLCSAFHPFPLIPSCLLSLHSTSLYFVEQGLSVQAQSSFFSAGYAMKKEYVELFHELGYVSAIQHYFANYMRTSPYLNGGVRFV